MTALGYDELRKLAELGLRPALSIVMPMHRAGGQIRQDAIRLKTKIREARDELGRWGLEVPLAERMLEPVEALLDDRPFWRQGADGLALFAGPNFFRHYHLDWTPREALVVGERFQVRALLPAVIASRPYHVLALSQHAIRLIAARDGRVEEIDLGDLPRRVEEALGSDTPEPNLQHHVVTTPARGRAGTAIHGHIPDLEDHKEQLRQLWSRVDERVRRLLPDPNSPLVLAAVEYMASLYRQVNTHPGLLADAITGSPEGVSSADLAERAFPLARARLEEGRRRALERYARVGPGLATHDLEAVLLSAADGRISDLLLTEDAERWGRFDRASSTLRVEERSVAGSEDLVNLAVALTLEHVGAVHACPRDEMPDGADLAALLRY